MTKVSVIIPCYNQGMFVIEAIDSVLAQTFTDVEIIIVNDGSTDDLTNRLLSEQDRPDLRVITTANQGLAAARNTGISEASGEYILPLDADDRIAPEYIERAVQVLDAELDIGIVYCRARLFGAVDTEWLLPNYSLEEMLRDNVIFCSALYRRKDWQEVGGYDPGMVYGWEDYEFWLSLIERGRKVLRLDGCYFFYRVSDDSMVRSKDKQQKIDMFCRIYRRHHEFIGEHIEIWIKNLIDVREPYHCCRLYIDTGNGFNETDSIVRKITVGSVRVAFDLKCRENVLRLRFDPIDCPACLRIDSITLNTGDRTISVDPETISSNGVVQDGATFMFDDRDPQLFLPRLQERATVSSLEINFCILATGQESLQEIIKYMSDRKSTHQPVTAQLLNWVKKNFSGTG